MPALYLADIKHIFRICGRYGLRGFPFPKLFVGCGNTNMGIGRACLASSLRATKYRNERSLKMSWLGMRTGCSPDCSRPIVGLRSAQRILAPQYFGHASSSSDNPSSASPTQRQDLAWHTPQPGDFALAAPTSRGQPSGSRLRLN